METRELRYFVAVSKKLRTNLDLSHRCWTPSRTRATVRRTCQHVCDVTQEDG
jgi:hypothetical protein